MYTFIADAPVCGSTEAGHGATSSLWIAAGLPLLLSVLPLMADANDARPALPKDG